MTQPERSHEWSDLRGIRIEPMILNHGAIEAWANHRTSVHPFFAWWWLDVGSVTLEVRERRLVVPAGHWVLIPPGLVRHQAFSDDARVNSINFSARWANGLPLFRVPGPVVQAASSRDGLIRAAVATQRAGRTRKSSSFVRLDQRKLGVADHLRLTARLADFVELLLRQPPLRSSTDDGPGTGDARLDHVLDQLGGVPRAGSLPYESWREAHGLGRAQLDRLARQYLGRSLRRHRDELLLAEIHRRLALDHSSIKRHAYELGFVDSAHFCRWVKQHTGLTPKTLAAGQT